MKATMAVRLGLMIAALFTAGTAVAQGPGIGPGFGDNRPPMERMMGPRGQNVRWWNNPQMIDKLKLTDEQRKAMDGILLEHREKLIDLHANLQKAELAMDPLINDDQPNEAKILAQIDKVAQARADLEKANARFLLAIRAKLTPDQWKQLQAERQARRMNHPGWGQGRGGMRMMAPPAPPAPPAPAQGSAPAAPPAQN